MLSLSRTIRRPLRTQERIQKSRIIRSEKSEVCHEANARRRRKPPSRRHSERQGRQTSGWSREGFAFEKGARSRVQRALYRLARLESSRAEVGLPNQK